MLLACYSIVIVVFLALFFSFLSRIHWSVAVLATYCIARTLLASLPITEVNYAAPAATWVILWAGLRHVLWIVVVGFAVTIIVQQRGIPKNLLMTLGVVDSLVVLGQAALGFPPLGVLGEPSLNGCVIAICSSFLPWIALPLALVAILLSSSASATILLFLVVLLRFRGIASFLAFGIPISATALYGKTLFLGFSEIERLTQWFSLMRWWFKSGSLWFGHGGGSTFVLIPHLQRTLSGPTATYWTHLHSDALKFVFEYGVVGVALLVPLLATLCFTRDDDRPAVASVLVFMAMQYPSTLPVHGLICALVLGGGLFSVQSQHDVSRFMQFPLRVRKFFTQPFKLDV